MKDLIEYFALLLYKVSFQGAKVTSHRVPQRWRKKGPRLVDCKYFHNCPYEGEGATDTLAVGQYEKAAIWVNFLDRTMENIQEA